MTDCYNRLCVTTSGNCVVVEVELDLLLIAIARDLRPDRFLFPVFFEDLEDFFLRGFMLLITGWMSDGIIVTGLLPSGMTSLSSDLNGSSDDIRCSYSSFNADDSSGIGLWRR